MANIADTPMNAPAKIARTMGLPNSMRAFWAMIIFGLAGDLARKQGVDAVIQEGVRAIVHVQLGA